MDLLSVPVISGTIYFYKRYLTTSIFYMNKVLQGSWKIPMFYSYKENCRHKHLKIYQNLNCRHASQKYRIQYIFKIKYVKYLEITALEYIDES